MAITHWRLKMSLCSVQLERRTQATGTQSCSSPPRGIDSKNQKPKTNKSRTNLESQKVYHPTSRKALEREVKQPTELNGSFLLWLCISQSLPVISSVSKRCPGTPGKASTNLSANILSWENFHTKWLYSHNIIKGD